jgi:hypothetical protein
MLPVSSKFFLATSFVVLASSGDDNENRFLSTVLQTTDTHSKSSSTHAQYVAMQKYFSHPRLVIYFFPTSPIKPHP